MLSSKVWLITGANSGLGLTLAQCVLSKGDKVKPCLITCMITVEPYHTHQVIAAARDAAKIPASLSGAKAYTLDPSAPEDDVKRAAKEALKIYGRIDVLVNNAGYGQPGTLEELQCVLASWSVSARLIESNLASAGLRTSVRNTRRTSSAPSRSFRPCSPHSASNGPVTS